MSFSNRFYLAQYIQTIIIYFSVQPVTLMIDIVCILFFIQSLWSLTYGMFLTAHLNLDWP